MTGQASKVVKGMRTIGANILNAAQSADTLDISVNGVTKSIALLDETTGDMRSTYDVLKDIAKEWDNMTNAEKSSLALSLSGKTQIDVFTSVLSNFDSAINAVDASLKAAGSAEKENEKYLKSLQASVQAIKQEFTKLVLGDGGLEKFAKMLLDSATAVLKFINAIGGMNTILTTLGVATLITVIYNFEKLQKAVKSGLALFQTFGNYINNTLNNYLNAYINSTIAFADAEEAAAAAAQLEAAGIEMVKLSLSALVAVLGLVFIAYQKYKQAQEEARQEAISTAEEYEEQAKKFDEQLAKIKDEATTRAELCEIIKNQLGDAYDQEKEDLKDINELRQEAIDKLYEEAQASARETERELGSQYQSAKEALEDTDTFTARAGGYGAGHARGTSGVTVTVEGTPEERYAQIGAKLDEYNKKRQEGIELSNKELEVEKQLTEEYNRLKAEIEDNKSIVDAYEEACEILNKTLEEWLDSAQTTNDETGNLNDALSELGYNYNELEEALNASGGSIDTFNDLLNESTDSAVTYAQGILGASESSESLTDAIDNQIASMESLAESYTTLQAIADEYNSTGQLSLETIRQLNQLTAEQVAALEFHNGVASVNVDLLKQQYEIEKQEAINKLQLAKQIAIVALEEQYLNQEAEATGSQLETQQTINENTATTYNDIYTAASKAAAGVAKVRAALGEDSDEYKQFLEDRKSIIDEYDAMIDGLKNSELELADTSKKAAKSSSASHSSAAKKTEDAWKKAFDEEKKALDHMHEMNEISDEEYYNRLLELNEKYFGEASGQHEKYLDEYRKNEETAFKGLQKVYKDRLKKQTDAQLKALKQQKDAALKAIDAEIKGVKKAKDAALKAIDERIKAIKKQKDEAVKAIEAEIKALNKQKEAQHKYFQDKIDALQRAHDLQEQINQLEEYENQLAQAKAQRVWVMKDGQFQLGENEEAVNTAEQQLSDYKDDLDYERQLQELQDLQAYWDEYYDNLIEKKEEYKDYIEEYYDQQIEALEEYRDRVEEEYDAQIEALEEYRDQVEEMYDNMIEAYKEHVDAMLEAFDKFNEGNKEKYGTAIDDLRAFVAEWNGLIASMSSIDGAMSGVTGFMSSGMVSLKHHSGGAAEIGSYASGNGSSVKDDEIALVGESPNTEMLIGSKVNTGVVARLHKGSGVVNAESTKTLAGILNKLGKNKYIGNSSTEGSGVTQNFTFGSISLPNVTDANSFVEALRTTFGSYSVQYANAKA